MIGKWRTKKSAELKLLRVVRSWFSISGERSERIVVQAGTLELIIRQKRNLVPVYVDQPPKWMFRISSTMASRL